LVATAANVVDTASLPAVDKNADRASGFSVGNHNAFPFVSITPPRASIPTLSTLFFTNRDNIAGASVVVPVKLHGGVAVHCVSVAHAKVYVVFLAVVRWGALAGYAAKAGGNCGDISHGDLAACLANN